MSEEKESDSSTSESEISPFSSKFDPIKALYSEKASAPVKNAPMYENLAHYESAQRSDAVIPVGNRELVVKRDEEKERIKLKREQVIAEINKQRFSKYQSLIPNPRKEKRGRNVLTRMENMSGPLRTLLECVEKGVRVKIMTRNDRGIRGVLYGVVSVFDKQWNLALTDVLEIWKRKGEKKRKVQPMADGTPVPKGTATLLSPVPVVTETPIGNGVWECTRYIPQLMVRGEHVVLVNIYDSLSSFLAGCRCSQPELITLGGAPFMVYFDSHHRGMCMGVLINRFMVLTAAVCVTNPLHKTIATDDIRPITVYVGTQYRHVVRGLRVPIKQILLPNFEAHSDAQKGYLMQISVAVLVMKHNVPDSLVEVPARPVVVDYKGETSLLLQDECLSMGYHFFYRDDQIYDGHKFLLQRNMRAQYLNIVKTDVFCDVLELKFQANLEKLGFRGFYDKDSQVCVKDGMMGAPLICHGKVVGVLMAPDGQWINCTGFSNLFHTLSARNLKAFLSCLDPYFQPEFTIDMKKYARSYRQPRLLQNGEPLGDYVKDIYDKMVYHPGDSDEN